MTDRASAFTIVTLVPSLLDTNGDAQNAAVLARRLQWAGHEAQVVAVEDRSELPEQVDAVIVGSGNDSTLEPARERLLTMHDELRRWGTEGVPILSVGTGWELLSWGVESADGRTVEGLGVLPGRAVPRATRATGDLVVRSPRFGHLVGFENHARDYVQAEASPLGRIVSGIGNGRDAGQEGVVMGWVLGTHLHGPVLAKNPAMADAIATEMATRAGVAYEPGERTAAVDAYAEEARRAQLRAAGVALPA
ncbi:type 1 glutamine amidotransferase [Agromyces aerolatus]|uniref:type 1 glutamine amidotransferase n=1 Tax=Agromyces sp. LY-1074 TaxID=3074080 RepID=UPI00286434BA|nr:MULTISPECIES: cobyric acid synthase [unclassified Agromyces]MDR5700137.1 cobyric acid synthase [Agromyces sp. LY-1074]MDR5706495.1 cobyric acid synthase [Agromyces sp. LY-1358]